jgi:hypothetical protein
VKGDDGSPLYIDDALTHPPLRKSIINCSLLHSSLLIYVLFLLPHQSGHKQNNFKIVATLSFTRHEFVAAKQLGWVGTAQQDFNVNKISTA